MGTWIQPPRLVWHSIQVTRRRGVGRRVTGRINDVPEIGLEAPIRGRVLPPPEPQVPFACSATPTKSLVQREQVLGPWSLVQREQVIGPWPKGSTRRGRARCNVGADSCQRYQHTAGTVLTVSTSSNDTYRADTIKLNATNARPLNTRPFNTRPFNIRPFNVR